MRIGAFARSLARFGAIWALACFSLWPLQAAAQTDEIQVYTGGILDEDGFTSEIRPILGLHLGDWDIFINPILDSSWDGFKNLDFAPATRIAYNFSKVWAVAVEHYADFGPIKKFLPGSEQSHQIFAVMDYSGEP